MPAPENVSTNPENPRRLRSRFTTLILGAAALSSLAFAESAAPEASSSEETADTLQEIHPCEFEHEQEMLASSQYVFHDTDKSTPISKCINSLDKLCIPVPQSGNLCTDFNHSEVQYYGNRPHMTSYFYIESENQKFSFYRLMEPRSNNAEVCRKYFNQMVQLAEIQLDSYSGTAAMERHYTGGTTDCLSDEVQAKIFAYKPAVRKTGDLYGARDQAAYVIGQHRLI